MNRVDGARMSAVSNRDEAGMSDNARIFGVLGLSFGTAPHSNQ